MAFQISPPRHLNTPPRQEILLLKPFGGFPKLSFDKVKVGHSCTRSLLVRNVESCTHRISLEHLVPKDKGFKVNPEKFEVFPGYEKILHFTWQPLEEKGCRVTIPVRSEEGFKGQVVLIGSIAVAPSSFKANRVPASHRRPILQQQKLSSNKVGSTVKPQFGRVTMPVSPMKKSKDRASVLSEKNAKNIVPKSSQGTKTTLSCKCAMKKPLNNMDRKKRLSVSQNCTSTEKSKENVGPDYSKCSSQAKVLNIQRETSDNLPESQNFASKALSRIKEELLNDSNEFEDSLNEVVVQKSVNDLQGGETSVQIPSALNVPSNKTPFSAPGISDTYTVLDPEMKPDKMPCFSSENQTRAFNAPFHLIPSENVFDNHERKLLNSAFKRRGSSTETYIVTSPGGNLASVFGSDSCTSKMSEMHEFRALPDNSHERIHEDSSHYRRGSSTETYTLCSPMNDCMKSLISDTYTVCNLQERLKKINQIYEKAQFMPFDQVTADTFDISEACKNILTSSKKANKFDEMGQTDTSATGSAANLVLGKTPLLTDQSSPKCLRPSEIKQEISEKCTSYEASFHTDVERMIKQECIGDISPSMESKNLESSELGSQMYDMNYYSDESESEFFGYTEHNLSNIISQYIEEDKCGALPEVSLSNLSLSGGLLNED